ncbi:MAG: hypothetical protein AABX38_06035 [Candidatus Micrarchaeota archaeon]
MIVVVDTGFISSMLKINRIELIFRLFEIEQILAPIQVLEEIQKSPFFMSVAYLFSYDKENISKILVIPMEISSNQTFGKGEMACIKLAKEKNGILLIDDKKALEKAEKEGLVAISLASFLLMCKKTEIVSNIELKIILTDLKNKDYYVFSKGEEEAILSDD